MTFKKLPPLAEINKHFDVVKGFLVWKLTNSGRATIGKRAGFISKTDGYIYVRLNNKRYAVHRIIWKTYTGKDPIGQIDHIDGNKINNTAKNLRAVSNVENSRNAKINNLNKSGVTGVSFCKRTKKWYASIRINYVKKNLGLYKSKEEAISARKKAEKEFLFHENHGRKS